MIETTIVSIMSIFIMFNLFFLYRGFVDGDSKLNRIAIMIHSLAIGTHIMLILAVLLG